MSHVPEKEVLLASAYYAKLSAEARRQIAPTDCTSRTLFTNNYPPSTEDIATTAGQHEMNEQVDGN